MGRAARGAASAAERVSAAGQSARSAAVGRTRYPLPLPLAVSRSSSHHGVSVRILPGSIRVL